MNVKYEQVTSLSVLQLYILNSLNWKLSESRSGQVRSGQPCGFMPGLFFEDTVWWKSSHPIGSGEACGRRYGRIGWSSRQHTEGSAAAVDKTQPGRKFRKMNNTSSRVCTNANQQISHKTFYTCINLAFGHLMLQATRLQAVNTKLTKLELLSWLSKQLLIYTSIQMWSNINFQLESCFWSRDKFKPNINLFFYLLKDLPL